MEAIEKIADSIEALSFGENNLLEINAFGKDICLGKHNDTLVACAAKCPHAGALMANGYLDAMGNIVCPLHRYKFNMQNGRNITGEGYYLKTYNVIVKEDGVYISLEKKKSFFDIFN
jgi:nitrite reductase/ring-hydroxylating ferredoxin subunit